jgi:hypothetical protein
MKQPIIITILFISIYIFFVTGIVFAAENSLLIELPKKINKSLANISQFNQQHELKIKEKEAQIKNIVYDLQNARNQDQIYSLQQEYHAIRAENLASEADKLIRMESEFFLMAQNLEQLEKARSDSHQFGIGAGIDRNDPKTKQIIQNTLKGFENIMHMVKNNNPGINLSNEYDAFQIMNSTARAFYTNHRNDSLEDEKRFVLGCLSLSISLKKYLRSEQDHLLSNMYYIDASQMRRKFGEIKVGILGSGNIIHGLKKYHSMDEKILSYSKVPESIQQTNYNTEFNGTIVDW